MKKVLFLSIITFLPFLLFSQTYVPGQIYYDSTGYIEYRAGNLPIILSSPHGGNLRPSSIPNRNCSGCKYTKDAWTKEVTEGIYNEMSSETGCYPHVIINWLHRKKLDANRDIIEAADGNPTAETAWQAYHDFIDAAKHQIIEDYGRGLFLDIHGHAHPIQRIELGYLLSKNELQLSDSMLNKDTYIDKSSIRTLVGDNIQNFSHSELLRGQYSFGVIMDNKGFPCIPSSSNPFPLASEPYFAGGYNTKQHGSRDDNGKIDGIQVELNHDIRFNSVMRGLLIDSLTSGINEYIDHHYYNQYINNYCALILGVQEKTNIDLKLYPNPANNFVTITNIPIGSKLKVIDISGKLVYNSIIESEQTTISTMDIVNGVYIIQVENNGEVVNRELVVIK